jgi:hypothetical protein
VALIREAIDATVEQHAPKPRSLGVGASEPLVIPSPVLVEVDYWIGQRLTFGQAFDADGLTRETVDIGGSSDDYRFDGLGIAVGGIFAGASQRKTDAQAATFGGSADTPYDACYHLACDTVDNVDAVLLAQMARAAARVVGDLAGGGVELERP